jgi:hypothetical protein
LEKIQSAFSAARNWDADVHTAPAIQIALGLALAATIAWPWYSDAAFELKASALATASLLATPYVLDYDLVVLAVAIAFFARHGLRCGFRDTRSACSRPPGSCRGFAAGTTHRASVMLIVHKC